MFNLNACKNRGRMNPGTRRAVRGSRATVPVVRAGARKAPRFSTGAEQRARELVLVAAHDLRAPLAAVMMQLARVRRQWQAGRSLTRVEWEATLGRMEGTIDRAFTLIDDVLTVAHLQGQSCGETGGPIIDIEAVVQDAIELQREALERARCTVALDRDRGRRALRGAWNRGHLVRIFSNLLRNVIRHAPGAPVRITLGRRGDRLRILFADRGPGLPRDFDARAIGQSGNEQAEAGIHGLGLWIVGRAVAELGGRLSIDTEHGEGVAFDLELPGLKV
jgi:two-component system, OmpR family, sensor histidine kinase KdpD